MYRTVAILLTIATASIPLQPAIAATAQCRGPTTRIGIEAASDMAGRRPIRVELVFITDPTLARLLSAMTARDYFAAHAQIERDFPRGWRFTAWEIQANQVRSSEKVRAPCGVVSTLLFADYPGDGVHRQSLGRAAQGILLLGAKEFKWVPVR